MENEKQTNQETAWTPSVVVEPIGDFPVGKRLLAQPAMSILPIFNEDLALTCVSARAGADRALYRPHRSSSSNMWHAS